MGRGKIQTVERCWRGGKRLLIKCDNPNCTQSAYIRIGNIYTCMHCFPRLIEENLPLKKPKLIKIMRVRDLLPNSNYSETNRWKPLTTEGMQYNHLYYALENATHEEENLKCEVVEAEKKASEAKLELDLIQNEISEMKKQQEELANKPKIRNDTKKLEVVG